MVTVMVTYGYSQFMKRRGRNEGGITFLKSKGVYVASIYTGTDASGKPTYRKAQRKTKTEAVKALQELRASIGSGQDIRGDDLLVSEWLDRWMADFVSQRAPKTVKTYEQIVRTHLKPGLGKVPLRKLSPSQVASFLNRKKQHFASNGGGDKGLPMLRNIRAVLRAALKRAVALGHASTCAVNEATTVPQIRRPEAPFLSPQQCAALLDALSETPIKDLVQFVMATGLRVGEATGLRVSDVDLASSCARVEVQLQRVGGALELRPLKTIKSRRDIPLNALATTAVTSALSAEYSGAANELGLVFRNSRGGPFDQKNIDKWLKRALFSAGLPSMGMHGLRHTTANTLLHEGVPLHTVSRMLGHSSITLTANTYGHILQASHVEASNTLAAAIQQHVGVPKKV